MSVDKEQSRGQLPLSLTYVVAIVVAVVALAALVYWVQFSFHLDRPLSTDPAEWGQLGDYIGGILNPIVALAALLLLALGVQIQNETLREAKEQLSLQRTELEQTREILKQQSKELAQQAEAAQKQVFEGTFFRMLESLRRLVEGYEISATSRGITAMFDWAVGLRDHDGRRLASEECSPDEAATIVQRWYPTHRPRLASYFASVVMILEFVEKSGRPDAIFYLDILRATFSPGELFLLFHHGAGDGGNTRFHKLAAKYGLLDGFDPTNFDLPNRRRQWYSVSQIARDYAVRI